MTRTTGDQRDIKSFVVCECMLDMQEPKDYGEDIRVDLGICGRGLLTEIDERGLEITIPEEAVVGDLPECFTIIWLSCLHGVALKGIGQVVGVGEVKRVGAEMLSD